MIFQLKYKNTFVGLNDLGIERFFNFGGSIFNFFLSSLNSHVDVLWKKLSILFLSFKFFFQQYFFWNTLFIGELDVFSILINKVVYKRISNSYIYSYNKYNFVFYFPRKLRKNSKIFPVYKLLNLNNVVRSRQNVRGLSTFAYSLKRSVSFQEKF